MSCRIETSPRSSHSNSHIAGYGITSGIWVTELVEMAMLARYGKQSDLERRSNIFTYGRFCWR
jgi:hypothetical protein